MVVVVIIVIILIMIRILIAIIIMVIIHDLMLYSSLGTGLIENSVS